MCECGCVYDVSFPTETNELCGACLDDEHEGDR